MIGSNAKYNFSYCQANRNIIDNMPTKISKCVDPRGFNSKNCIYLFLKEYIIMIFE